MTTLDISQQSDWLKTELKSMSSQEDSHAKTFQSLENSRELEVSDQGYGQKFPVLLASYDLSTQSWKTSQTSLLAIGDDGLDEFSETWPRSGMTRNGIAYQLPNLARTTTEIGSGLWPTIRASEWKGAGPLGSKSHKHMLDRNYLCAVVQEADQKSGGVNPSWAEWLMGFPIGHTDLGV